MAQKSRQLQLVKSEHRQREHDENKGECAQHPGVLQRRGEQCPRQGGSHARAGVCHRHAEHVGKREEERAQLAEILALAGDDPREDRDHRQHAGREGEQQPEAEETRQHDPGAAGFEQPGDLEVARLNGEFRRRVGPCAGRRRGKRRELDRRLALHRDVAHADIGATLRGHRQIQLIAGAFHRHADRDLLAVGLDLAEELVLLLDPGRELRRAEPGLRGRIRGEPEPFAVHVVALGDRETHFHGMRVQRARRHAERFFGLEQVVRARRRDAGRQPTTAAGGGEIYACGSLVSAATQSR